MSSKLRIALVGSLCACLLAGCLPSLHPLYSEDATVFREELLGTWRFLYRDGAGVDLTFESIDDKAYRMTITGADEVDLVYLAHLVEVGDYMYLNFQLDFDERNLIHFNTLPSHQICRIRFDGDDLVTETHDEPWLTSYLTQHPDELDHTFIEIGKYERLVITADTEELQQFFIAHGNDWEVASENHWYRVDDDR